MGNRFLLFNDVDICFWGVFWFVGCVSCFNTVRGFVGACRFHSVVINDELVICRMFAEFGFDLMIIVC